MESQLGLVTLWTQGDGITRAVAGLLLIMSLASWVVMISKALDIIHTKALAQRTEAFWHSKDFASGMDVLGANLQTAVSHHHTNPFVQMAQAGQEATAHHRNTQAQLHDTLDVSDWISRTLRNSIDDSTVRLQSGLAVLASVGSTAPFVGLFGTVWGIYHALVSIGASGQAGIETVAGPIGEALIMTALGLAVAIPAVLGYNTLLRGNKFILTKLNRFAHDLHAYFVTGARVGQQRGGLVLPLHGTR